MSSRPPARVLRRGRRGLKRAAPVLLAVFLVLLAAAPPVSAVPPVITPVFTGTAGQNGWWRSNVTVQFQISGDVTSSSGCDIRTLTTDGTHNEVLCTATGPDGTAQSNPIVRIDKTAPTVAALLERSPDQNGWFNHGVKLSITSVQDETSGISGPGACSTPSYTGPDSATASVTASCPDTAGNIATPTIAAKYDDTAPTVTAALERSPDQNGWFNHGVKLNLTNQQDATSGLSGCSAPTYTGPDSATAAVTGTCSDLAGNSVTPSITAKYDDTAPTVTAALERSPDQNGWFNHGVKLSLTNQQDATSGLSGCSAPTYAGPDSATAAVTGSCSDVAGNSVTPSITAKYDDTAPTVNAALERAADQNGWFNHGVKLTFTSLQDATSGPGSCNAPTYTGPDSATAAVTGTCSDVAGNVATPTIVTKYDDTAPTVTAALERQPDQNTWFNKPVKLALTNLQDSVSGPGGCNTPSYSGPDSSTAAVTGSCSDVAGNTITPSITVKFDDTAPTVSAALERAADQNTWFNKPVKLTLTNLQDNLSGPGSCNAPSYTGPDSSTAAVTGSCSDVAGNTTAPSITVKFDDTPPNVTTALSPAPNANGWNRTQVTYTVSAVNDATSGLPATGACTPPAAYNGPDNSSKVLTGSCTDVAGNPADRQATVKYDATPPTVNAAVERPPDHNGWFNASVKLSLTNLQDATSGPGTCSASAYTGPDSATAALTGTCGDLAGNTVDPSITVKYDDTAPTVTGALARPPNASGWYTQPVQLKLTSSDATSGIDAASCSEPTYGSPDDASAGLTGGCSDVAGNRATSTVAFKYDATAPSVTAVFARVADANDWYNHAVGATISGSDAVSGLDSCVQPQVYSGPDSATAQMGGSCSDKAGNTTGKTVTFKYDATAPTVSPGLDRPPDGSGWYNHAVSLVMNGQDETSGIASCTQAGYQGPDTSDTSLSGSCVDRAGNPSGQASAAFKYDSTAPHIAASLDRGPDVNGWFNHSVKLTASGEDALSGLASCSSPTYSGPDGSGASLTATCSDAAGNTASTTADFRYDSSGPAVDAALARGPDANGWYNHAVQLTASGSDGASGLVSCSSPTYAGPDNRGAALSATCTDVAGNTGSRTVTFRYDATAPSVTAELARPANANGWYNAPVKLTTVGADGTSGLESCSSPTYGGPDDPTASLTATCRDLAGNASSQTVSLRYDSTPPRLDALTVASRNRSLVLTWRASSDVTLVTVKRSRVGKGSRETTVYKGKARSFADRRLENGVRYRYEVDAIDVAGNVKSLVAAAEPRALRTPLEGQRVKRPPTLTWWGVAKADYYNVQLFRGRVKLLSLWPVLEKLVLKRSWRYEGRSFRLGPGLYRWYVWPGFGPRKLNRYGGLLGGGTFRVVR